MDLLQNSRYKDTPVYLFFEKYILDVIGHLPPEKVDILQSMNLQHIFGTHAENWRDVIKEVLKLSTTIDITILHQWYKALEDGRINNYEVDASNFSKEFVDRYFAEDSVLDVWTEETLMEAKQFIQESQLTTQV